MFGGNAVIDWHPNKGRGGGGVGEKKYSLSLPATETGMSAGLMDCLEHYADLTSTV